MQIRQPPVYYRDADGNYHAGGFFFHTGNNQNPAPRHEAQARAFIASIVEDMFLKVPGYEGRGCERHGSEGDTVIGKACITGKGVNEKGEHFCDVALWAENLDGDIIQTCPSQIILPARG